MALDIELADAKAQVTIDFMAGLGISVAQATERAALLSKEIKLSAPRFTEEIYRRDPAGGQEKEVADVVITVMTMASQIMISNRKSIRDAVQDAMSAIRAAVLDTRTPEANLTTAVHNSVRSA